MTVSIEHLAVERPPLGVQYCVRCGEVLSQFPLGAWPEGAVFRLQGDGVTQWGTSPIGDDAVPCQAPQHEHTCVRCGTVWLHGYGGCERRGRPSEDCPACTEGKYV